MNQKFSFLGHMSVFPFVSGFFLTHRRQGVVFLAEMLQNKSPIFYDILLSTNMLNILCNIIHTCMCAHLYARMLSFMSHGLTSMASVNCGIAGGIPCQISDSYSLHKIWLKISCVIIFR